MDVQAVLTRSAILVTYPHRSLGLTGACCDRDTLGRVVKTVVGLWVVSGYAPAQTERESNLETGKKKDERGQANSLEFTVLKRRFTNGLLLLVWAALLARPVSAADALTETQLELFETRIRPVLVEQCYTCHNSTARAEGGLAVDQRDAFLRGGDGGVIVVPGRPGESRLLAILRHEVDDLKMPRDAGKLAGNVVADFEKWIVMGAPDPRDHAPSADELATATSWEKIFASRKKWWSFQPVRPVEPPVVEDSRWSEHPVDRFVMTRLQEQGLMPADRASPRVLLRRVTFALTGLPPTPQAMSTFLADTSPNAFEKVVDRLLDSPQFGERWARHWMDLVRYCESHGSQGDPQLPYAFRYRDYLIRALNADVPYDQLVREHLAGDLLAEPRWNTTLRLNESVIGPAHLRMVELGYVPVDALDDQVKVVNNQIDVYSKAFLGLTASCARCHNHKFDPISQEDFYALYGIFVSSRPSQVLIDEPALLDKNRDALSQLKQKIRTGLAAAWLEAASEFSVRLQEETKRQTQLGELAARQLRVHKAVAEIENRARALVLKARGKSGGKSLPAPDARWSFDGDARDSVGEYHGELRSGAKVRGGRLILDGVAANVRTASLDRQVHEKTLEAWVALANLQQRGGGVIGLDTPGGQFFDSIVFGELNPQHWMAGSDFYRRSQDPGGAEETAQASELIHLAIVYAKDNSITVYRNGQPYGTTYRKGTLHPFLKGKSRFLFGQRLSGVNPPLAGEVEEARAYFKALSPTEVATSFQAGPAGVTAEELAAVLTVEQRDRLAELHAAGQRVGEELAGLRVKAGDPWTSALADASSDSTNPLHPWHQSLAQGAAEKPHVLRERWTKLADYWAAELRSRREFNQSHYENLWDLRGEQQRLWFRYGSMLDAAGRKDPTEVPDTIPARNGAFSIAPDGNRVVRGILPAAVYTHGLSSRHTGMLTSPRFLIETDNIFVRVMGRNSWVRLAIENYPHGNGGIYPAARLDQDEVGWVRLDTAYRKGSHAHLEVFTVDGNYGDPAQRLFFGAAQVVSGKRAELPRELAVPIASLLKGAPPASLHELAIRYGDQLRRVVQAWQEQSLSDDDRAFLDFFVRQRLLPTTIAELPQLRELVERYRQLENAIPVPRRVPGMREAAAFDQPLFERGQHTRPGPTVPRRGLSVLGTAPFATSQSGRLQLAEQTVSAANPLAARVMVNRLWHYLFGQGIVATVDNFGQLGEQPTHPELLDYLANRFSMDEKWSTKKMIRLMVTSQAWQQASVASAAARQLDPGNDWLSHMPVRRLEAEAIRDALLATSGQLNPMLYGPGVNVYFVKKTENGGYPKGPLDGDRRRSVYLRIRRNAHNPFLEVFDAPKPSTTRGRRDITNVPAQSLTMLNDPFVIDQSAKWAAALIGDGRASAQRVRYMFEVALSREPDSAELSIALEYLAEHATAQGVAAPDITGNAQIWQDFAQSLFCLKEFIYVR
ncbi:MAG: DUF1553 domain-containing protein [Planctomycetota bacterium]|nr:DUF1553 domain-containing protein [Planctomycetota bacterium]